MDKEQREEQVRAIVGEVLEGVKYVTVEEDAEGHWTVGIDLVNEDTGQVLPMVVATTRGDVVRPVYAAKLGVSAQVEELARRLGALGVSPTVEESPWLAQVRAIAKEVLEGAGEDGVIFSNDDGHLWVGVEAVVPDGQFSAIQFRLLATSRGDVPMPLLAAKIGLSAQAEELARRLRALGVRPVEAPLGDEGALIPEAVEDLRYGLALGFLSLPDILSKGGGGSWPELEDPAVKRRVLKQFAQDVRARLAEERGWPAVTESDRLEATFEDLRRAGIMVELSAEWTQVLDRARAQQERGQELWGAAFVRPQDIEDVLKGRPLHIVFGVLDESTPEKDAGVGQTVVEALRKHGFEPEWDGSAHSRIQVLPLFTWRRRRVHVDTTEHLQMSGFPAGLVELLPRLRTLSVEADDMSLYELAEMRSDSLEELTLEHHSEHEARKALPDLVARVKERFPRLRVLIVRDSDSFEETVHFDK